MTAGKSKREQRVTLAVKWFHLDHLEVAEIRERFIQQGYGEFTKRTIRRYLDDSEAEAVREQIREKHADVRLQVAERDEQLYKRARRDEFRATEEGTLQGVRPEWDRNETKRSRWVRAWQKIGPDHPDWPDWADPTLDTIIEFEPVDLKIEPGEKYYVSDPAGNPIYHTESVGIERDQPDLDGRRSARYEQGKHLDAKAKILGAYDDSLTISHEGEVSMDVELPEDVIDGVVASSRDRLTETSDSERVKSIGEDGGKDS